MASASACAPVPDVPSCRLAGARAAIASRPEAARLAVLASRNRLTASGQFQETVRRGRRAGGPLLVVHLLVPTGSGDGSTALPEPRAGFVVSRAVGPAVTRNNVKRRLRHLVREHLAGLPPGALLVVRALPPAAAAGSTELRAELTRCLGRARRAPGRADSPTRGRPVR